MMNRSGWFEAAGGERPRRRYGDVAAGGRTLRASACRRAFAGQIIRYVWSYRMRLHTGLTIAIAGIALFLAAFGGTSGVARAQAYPYGSGGMSVSSGGLSPISASSGGAA